MVYVIAVVVVLVVAVGAIIVLARRSSGDASTEQTTTTPVTRPESAPMTGLESALAQVTDRAGNPIGERIEAESKHVDDLRVPDDTGPLLRRALDHVAQPGDHATPPSTGEQPDAEPSEQPGASGEPPDAG